jgi:hypothetical protein
VAATVYENGSVKFENGNLGMAVLSLGEDGTTPSGGAAGVSQVNNAAGVATEVGYDAASTQLPTNIPQLHYDEDSIATYEGVGTPFTVSKSAATETDAIAAPGAGFALEVMFFTTKQVGASSVNVSFKEADGIDVIVHEMIAQGSTDAFRGPWRLTANNALVSANTGSGTGVQIESVKAYNAETTTGTASLSEYRGTLAAAAGRPAAFGDAANTNKFGTASADVAFVGATAAATLDALLTDPTNGDLTLKAGTNPLVGAGVLVANINDVSGDRDLGYVER